VETGEKQKRCLCVATGVANVFPGTTCFTRAFPGTSRTYSPGLHPRIPRDFTYVFPGTTCFTHVFPGTTCFTHVFPGTSPTYSPGPLSSPTWFKPVNLNNLFCVNWKNDKK
ncbi:hypothetical protein Bpfe_028059, partial [Biomphalaria pfeifferi]